MSGMKTVALYGLEVPPGSILIPAMMEDSFPDASVSRPILLNAPKKTCPEMAVAPTCARLQLRNPVD
jgi:hypothetical protein